MVFGILKGHVSLFVVIRMRIGREIRMIGNQPPGHANFLVGPWCVGLLRSKIIYHSPPPKLNILLLLVDALSYYG